MLMGCGTHGSNVTLLSVDGKTLDSSNSSNILSRAAFIESEHKRWETPYYTDLQTRKALKNLLNADSFLRVSIDGQQRFVRAWSAIQLSSGRVFICGGCFADNQAAVNRSWFFEHGNLYPGPALHHNVCEATMTNFSDGRVLISGGRSSWCGKPVGFCEIYNGTTVSVADLGSMLLPRAQHQAIAVNAVRALLVGGETEILTGHHLITPTVEMVDVNTGEHTSLGALAIARSSPILVPYSGGILVVGGWHSVMGNDRWVRMSERFPIKP